ncbi:hypothetical protein AO724_12275 [Aeromonas allosaccharophila]|nr:hypothetical protein AO724_12275 [Aeromonas allosaccharophila]
MVVMWIGRAQCSQAQVSEEKGDKEEKGEKRGMLAVQHAIGEGNNRNCARRSTAVAHLDLYQYRSQWVVLRSGVMLMGCNKRMCIWN